MFSKIMLVGAAVVGLSSPSFAASQSYRIPANEEMKVVIGLCSPTVEVRIRGNGRTNLDYELKGPWGMNIFEEDGPSDRMQVAVRHGSNQCSEYKLQVENQGNRSNRFTVTLIDKH